MRSDELIAACRQSAFIGDGTSFTEYTDALVLKELNDKQQSVFEDIIVKSRSGYWLHYAYFTTTTSTRYRIPSRSVVGGLEKVELATTLAGPFTKYEEVPASIEQDYDGIRYVYTVQGDIIDLITSPGAGMVLRLGYYLRPPRLVTSQSSTLGGDGVDRGRITSIASIASRIVTVNAIPFDQSLAAPAAITTGVQSVDIVHPDGWHECPLVGASQTFSGLNITLGGTDDLSDVQVGDYVRVADQSDWPALPDDFNRSLADAAAVKLLIEQNLQEKAAALADNNGNDINRFRSLITPRVKASPKVIGIMRRSRGWTNGSYWR